MGMIWVLVKWQDRYNDYKIEAMYDPPQAQPEAIDVDTSANYDSGIHT